MIKSVLNFSTSACFLASFAAVANAATCTLTDGVWDTTPTAGDDVVLVSGDLNWGSALPTSVGSWTQREDYTNSTVTFDTGLDTFTVTGNVDLQGGTWTHTANPSLKSTDAAWINGRGTKQLIVSCGGDFNVGPKAKISASGRGFLLKQGPSGGYQGGGGSHGGNGVYVSGKCYGSPVSPITIGSGGRDQAGGGAIRLTVSGALTIDGSITADCLASGGDYHGAGGSVYLTADSMTGTGRVSAVYGNSGGTTPGGGGRIALKLTGEGDFSGLTGTITTSKMTTRNGNGNAGNGTIYYETKAQAGNKGKLVLDNGGSYSDVIGRGADLFDVGETYAFDEIVLQNGGRLIIHSGVTLSAQKITGHSYTYSYLELNGGTLNLPADYELTNVRIRNRAADSRLLSGTDGDLILGSGVYLYTTTAATELTVPGDLTVKKGGVVTTDANGNQADKGYGVRLNVLGNVTVESGGAIHADERGFNSRGPGYANSACHGGCTSTGDATLAYGSVKCPDTLGSDSKTSARNAGGRVRVKVGGCLTVDGRITTKGGCYNGGSGYSASGGSIWIDAATLAGSGLISALAGCASLGGNGTMGSGGRVAVYLTQDNATFDAFYAAGGEIVAPGGYCCSSKHTDFKHITPQGPCGTVYLSRTVDGVTNDVLVLRNRNSTVRNYGACIGPNVTDAEVGNVLFETNGVLVVGQDGLLKVHQNFTRDTRKKDAFVAAAGDADHTAGTVEFVDAADVSTVLGTNDFARLVVATPGKTVKFGTENDETWTKVGVFEITGNDLAKVNLRSTTDGTYWPLTVYGSAAVNFADVKDSDARPQAGLMISAKDSTDSGHNENWKFSTIVIGETITWTGDFDSSWSNAANWDREREPVDTDVVVIPSLVNKSMPMLSQALTLNSLEIQSGASLSLAGYYLTVTNVLTVAGSLVCSASEVIALSGPSVSFAGGSFTAASSTVLFSGSFNQSFNPGALAYYLVKFEKSGGTLTLGDDFSAYQFYVTPSAAMSVHFAAGKTVSVTDCYVSGGSETPLATFSSTTSARWNLNVSRQGRIRGVALANCAATGLTLNDDLPGTNEGNNDNWRFGGTFCQWTGASNANFTNEANWADGQAPDATSLVYFEGDASVTMTAPRTVREFQVASGTVEFAKGTNLLTVAENLSVEAGATLSLTMPCEVTNNVILRSGATLTHEGITSAPGALTNRLILTVGGDMAVEKDASVNVAGKGFVRACHGGFGYTDDPEWGPSHGGLGANRYAIELSKVVPAYDSVFAPIHPGSNCPSGDEDNDGGGVAILTIGGTLTLNGSVNANGNSGQWYFGAGGSVWITAGRFVGSGSVTANAGGPTGVANKKAAGGRISVCLTEGDFSQWTGTMTAYATWSQGDVERPYGGAGTVYLESASDGPKGGTIYVKGRMSSESSSFRSDVSTPLYSPGWDLPEDFRNVKIVVTGAETVSFPTNVTIRDLVLTGSGTQLPKAYLQDHTVRIRSRDHRYHPATDKVTGWTKTYSESVTTGTNGNGRILWPAQGMVILLH